MPTRVLLEGPAIEPLLAQVREEYGSGVRIISADKIRSGGFGGFFAKQHYELSVEVPDESEDTGETFRNRPPVAEPPQTLEQLLERAEARDHIAGADRPGATGVADDIGRSHGRNAGIGDTEAAASGAMPVRNGFAPATGNGAGSMSDTHNAFAELMAGLDNANAVAAASAPLNGLRRPAPKPAPRDDRDDDKPESGVVRPFRPATATGSPVNGSSSAVSAAAPVSPSGPPATVPGAAVRPLPPVPSLAELMGGLGLNDLDALATSNDHGAGHRPSAGPSRSALSAAAAYGRSMAEAPAVAAPTARAAITSGAEIVIANLVRVGMPEALAETITGGDTYAGVLTALSSRPAAPAIPDGPGEILVLVGDLTHALACARQCLEEIGLDGGHLLLAAPSAAGTGIHSSKVIPGPEDAKRRIDKLHTADSAWVVAMEGPVGGTNSAWVRETCEAIGATAVWAVVDATRKTADTAKHLKLLGDVEAVVVHGVENTGDPATVLGLDLPVVSLDGKPATPHAWAAMLCARIATDVTPPPAPARRPARGR